MPAPKIRRASKSSNASNAAPTTPPVAATPDAATAVPLRTTYGADGGLATVVRRFRDAMTALGLTALLPYCDRLSIPAERLPNGKPRPGALERFYSMRFGASSSDVPALLDLAARVTSTCIPTMHANPLPADALDSLAAMYYYARNAHPLTQSVSDPDRRDVAAHIARALVASCDAHTSRSEPRYASGKFGTRDESAHVVHGIAFHVRNMRAALESNASNA